MQCDPCHYFPPQWFSFPDAHGKSIHSFKSSRKQTGCCMITLFFCYFTPCKESVVQWPPSFYTYSTHTHSHTKATVKFTVYPALQQNKHTADGKDAPTALANAARASRVTYHIQQQRHRSPCFAGSTRQNSSHRSHATIFIIAFTYLFSSFCHTVSNPAASPFLLFSREPETVRWVPNYAKVLQCYAVAAET